MPTFRYKAVGTGAGPATVEAPDRASAVRVLLSRGVTPTSVEVADLPGPGANGGANGSRVAMHPAGFAANVATDGASSLAAGTVELTARAVLSRADAAALIRELATAVQAGLPLVQGLRTIARQGHSTKQSVMLEGVIAKVEHGQSLADAMHAQGRAFSELTVNMVRAGEASGRLGEVLMQAADLLDKEVKLRRSVLAATLYPMILGVLITIAVIVVVTVIVPKVLKPITNTKIVMPMPTRVVQAVAELFAGYWWLIIPAALISVLGLARLYRQPGPRLWWDRTVLGLPLIGRLLRDVAVGRFTRTLGTLVSSGVPVLQSLRITKGTLGNRAMEHVIDDVCEQVAGGKTIADPMEKSGYFPPMLVQIINIGERSGRLDQMLSQAADAFESKTETSVKLFTTALPPVLVVGLACVVGFVVLAILLPLLEMQEALG